MTSNIPVLIVGAGPTGLMMAYELARFGIAFRIIDKKPEQTQHSNAVALQPRTLEIFKQVGLVDEFLRIGQPCKSLVFYDKGKEFARANLSSLDSVYPYILALPQAGTEKILNAKLDELQHHVERSRELVDVKIHFSDIQTTIRHDDGVEETIVCQWLLGCDGAHSKVREKCGFQFPGDDLSEQFVVADGVLDSFLRHDQIHIFSANGYMLGVFPIGENRFRLGGNLQLGYERKIYTEHEIRELVAERSFGQLDARSVSWISPFWIHSKMSETMRRGNVFLLGDAAHIHSPVGGQGMNTGLQDAHNLGWKLALTIQGRADEKLLDSFQNERKPVIKEVVESTDRFTRFLLISNPVVLFFRKYLIKFMLSLPSINRYITRRMSQISIRYRNSCALDESGSDASRSPAVGERAPDVILPHNNHFYQYLNDTYHHILCFTGERDIFKMADCCKQITYELLGPYKDLVKLHLVTPHLIDEPVEQIFDENNIMHQVYQIKKPTIMMIRPDGYISFKTTELKPQALRDFLAGYLQ